MIEFLKVISFLVLACILEANPTKVINSSNTSTHFFYFIFSLFRKNQSIIKLNSILEGVNLDLSSLIQIFLGLSYVNTILNYVWVYNIDLSPNAINLLQALKISNVDDLQVTVTLDNLSAFYNIYESCKVKPSQEGQSCNTLKLNLANEILQGSSINSKKDKFMKELDQNLLSEDIKLFSLDKFQKFYFDLLVQYHENNLKDILAVKKYILLKINFSTNEKGKESEYLKNVFEAKSYPIYLKLSLKNGSFVCNNGVVLVKTESKESNLKRISVIVLKKLSSLSLDKIKEKDLLIFIILIIKLSVNLVKSSSYLSFNPKLKTFAILLSPCLDLLFQFPGLFTLPNKLLFERVSLTRPIITPDINISNYFLVRVVFSKIDLLIEFILRVYEILTITLGGFSGASYISTKSSNNQINSIFELLTRWFFKIILILRGIKFSSSKILTMESNSKNSDFKNLFVTLLLSSLINLIKLAGFKRVELDWYDVN